MLVNSINTVLAPINLNSIKQNREFIEERITIAILTISALLGTWQPVLELAGGGILSLPNGTLVIEEVSLADEGLYSCNVENGVGQPLSKTVWMSVNSECSLFLQLLSFTD